MARPLRIEFAGAVYHVMSRGNERRAIVRDDSDRQRRIDWLERTVRTYNWKVHAFVVMTNHDHLFLETPEPNLSKGMQYLNGSYTGDFNSRHRRAGHLFQGRFKAHLIEQEGHYHQVSRYVHLNPCRLRGQPLATLSELAGYRWSSYPGYHRASKTLDWVTYGRVLGDFGPGDPTARRRRYRRFVTAGFDSPAKSPFADAVHGFIVGSEQFVTKIQRLLGARPQDPEVPELDRLRQRPQLAKIVKTVVGQFGDTDRRWRVGSRADDASRAIAAYLARRRYGYPAKAVASALGYAHPSSVSHAIRRVESASATVQQTIKRLERRIKAR